MSSPLLGLFFDMLTLSFLLLDLCPDILGHGLSKMPLFLVTLTAHLQNSSARLQIHFLLTEPFACGQPLWLLQVSVEIAVS